MTMNFLFILFSVLLLFFFHFSTASRPHHHKYHLSEIPQIKLACKATRYPDTCETTITQSDHHLPQNPNATLLIQSAIWVSSQNLKTAQSMVKSIVDSSADNQNRTNVAKTCLDILYYSQYRKQFASEALSNDKIRDARAWFTASLVYEDACWGSFKSVNDTKSVNETMAFLNHLVGLTSNALSMMMSFDNFGDDINKWKPPQTERDGFWERDGSGTGGEQSGFDGVGFVIPSADVTVCKDGSCDYKTVQDAVNVAPDNLTASRFVIKVKEGVYEETVRVPLMKKNVVLIGDGMGRTVITGSSSVGQPGMTTYNSATVGVLGDGFMASGLTIQNTAGPDAHQAVAFRSDSDLSIIENCEFLGNQDTLYVLSLRQFYKNCRIQGNVDFIFGNSPAVFQDCQILIAPRQVNPEHGENNAITANGRTDPAQTTGFVFHNCVINGTEEYMKLYYKNPRVHKSYLGRPWKEYSRTVFINCTLEALINPEGWMPWSGDFALETLYYGEFGNIGAGSNLSARVPWSSQVPIEHVNAYSVQNFIQGDDWISV